MANQSQSSNNFSDSNERAGQHIKAEARDMGVSEEHMLLDYLLGVGFMWEEAVKLLHLREHLYENAEMQQRMADDSRMHFARWLYEHGEMSE